MREFWDAFSQQMTPRFHEISAYSIAFSCCWLLASHADLREGALIFVGSLGIVFTAVGLVVTAGLVLSLVHVFTKSKKSAVEKAVMGWFILGVSGVASFFVGAQMLPGRSSLTILLAAWNIVMSVLMLTQMAMQKYDIGDEDASLLEVCITTLILVILLLLADVDLHLSWPLTLSLCIFYSTSIVFVATWLADRLGLRLPFSSKD